MPRGPEPVFGSRERAELAAHDRSHLRSQVLDWWYAHGVDETHGGVLTCFSNDGRLRRTDKYTWSQGRWAWLTGRLAVAARRGIVDGDATWLLERSAQTAEFLLDHAMLPGDTTAYVTTREGEPIPDATGTLHLSVFADLFVVLGLAGVTDAARRMGVDPPDRWARAAHRLLVSADARIAVGMARSEPYPVPSGFTDLAGPMTTLHAAAELHRATGSELSERIAVRAARTLAGPGGLRTGAAFAEFSPADPADADTLLARHTTPGHVLEVLWFLLDAADGVPGIDALLGEWMVAAAQRALDLGRDEEHGGLLRYVDRDGGPPTGRLLDQAYERLVRSTWDTKLWWTHVEALVATARLAERYASMELAAEHRRLRAYVFETFPAADGQEWIQIRTRDGRPYDAVVALPVKDPMHVARSLLLLAEQFSAPPAGGRPARTGTETPRRNP